MRKKRNINVGWITQDDVRKSSLNSVELHNHPLTTPPSTTCTFTFPPKTHLIPPVHPPTPKHGICSPPPKPVRKNVSTAPIHPIGKDSHLVDPTAPNHCVLHILSRCGPGKPGRQARRRPSGTINHPYPYLKPDESSFSLSVVEEYKH